MGTNITIKMKTSTEWLLSTDSSLLSIVLMTDTTSMVSKHLIDRLNISKVTREMDLTNLHTL